MASWVVNVLVDRHSPGGEWSKQNRLLVDKYSPCGEWSKLTDLLMIAASCDILQDTFSSGLS